MRRHLLILCLCLPLGGCAANRTYTPTIVAAGGSVTDFDRGVPTSQMHRAGAAGTGNTIGTMHESPPSVAALPYAPPSGRRYAGPIVAPVAADAETVRRVQQSLSVRGYYQGQITGTPDDALADSIARFQADQGLRVTGRLDADTTSALGLPAPAPSTVPNAGRM